MDPLPDFDGRGCLPPGIHEAGWQAFCERFGATERRRVLLEGLADVLRALADASCRAVYVNGSFVTAKETPEDFDACWDPTDVDFTRVPPVLWEFADSRRAQKEAYGGELFPMDLPADVTGETFIEFFQRDRDGLPKGIVRLVPAEVPG